MTSARDCQHLHHDTRLSQAFRQDLRVLDRHHGIRVTVDQQRRRVISRNVMHGRGVAVRPVLGRRLGVPLHEAQPEQ